MQWYLVEVDSREDVECFKHVYPVHLHTPPCGAKTIIVMPALNGSGGEPVTFKEQQ